MVDVTLLGTGGMYPLPNRALTSLYVRFDGRAALIDCGEGTQMAIRAAGLKFKPIEAILITHFHADHISGLPGLLLTMGNEGRTEPLTMYGPQGLEHTVNALRVIVPELPFEMRFVEFSQTECSRFSCGGLEADVFPLDHGMPCLGYSFNLNRPGKFDPQAARAKGIPMQYWGRLQKGECVEDFVPSDVLGKPRKGIRFLYATDTRPVSALEQYGQDADLVILEGMFGEPEKQARAEVSHHMMMQEAAEIAAKVNAGELWLTHYSPATPEPEQFEAELRTVFANTVIAKDGQTKTLKFQDK
ncbi:MAG: ribonuclease Z [Oscillospiraceae bacterium]|nr:ribonuclease Z [Oscillospiraceae bacterium]